MRRWLLAAAVTVGALMHGATAAPPAQFAAWGSAGPELPRLPAGWREAPAEEAPALTWTPTAGDNARGYVVFVRDAMTPVGPADRGFAAEQVEELEASAARGEYEPVSFSIHALRALGNVRVEVGELRLGGGRVIPADHVDARVVRCVRTIASAKDKTYRLEPFLLEKRSAFDVPAGATRQVWLTIKVPEGAEAGDYAAAVTVRPEGAPPHTLKLTLRVLPFSLPPAPIETAVFYPRPPADDAMLRRQWIDVREHGCGGVEPLLDVQIASRDRAFGADDAEATRAHCRRMLRMCREVFGPLSRPATFGVGHQIAYFWDKQKNWFVFWPHDAKIESDLLKAVDVVVEAVAAEGGPPLRAYALDEAGAHNLLDEAAYYYRFLRQQRPKLAGWTSIGGGIAMGVDEIGRLSDCVDFLATNRLSPEIARLLVGRGKGYGIYNGGRHDAASMRFFHGFWAYKSGAEQVAQWCYHFGNGVFEGGGLRAADEGLVYMADDGPLPSVMWEAAREGIDDGRYLHLLRMHVEAGRASKDPAARKAAAEAERVIAELLGRIDWGFQSIAAGDRTPPPAPATLRKWRRRIVEQVLALHKLLDAEAVARARPPRPDPTRLPWARPAREELRYGPELLPAGGFTKGLAPWRVEAWQGKGSGAIDRSVAPDSAPSVRIDAPADSGSGAVTVLVWPSWGGSKLDVRLEGERVYELSARAKWKDRGTPPSMRIALPDTAAGPAREAAEAPDPAGWHRIWARVEANHPAVPKYLAVWVQGPGTVWVGDLSLREVLPRPVSLALDQPEYDGLDRVGIATVTVGRGVVPKQLRFTLLRGEKVVARQAAPFAARMAAGPDAAVRFIARADLRQCEALFSPAALGPGDYEARVELLDGAGQCTASASAPFVRLAVPVRGP